MAKYRKKPVVITAIQWTGENWPDLDAFTGGHATAIDQTLQSLSIHTLEGTMRAEKGDWIIRGITGELYLCKPGIFEATYEPVEDL